MAKREADPPLPDLVGARHRRYDAINYYLNFIFLFKADASVIKG
jgi:hypothetical protein